MSRRRSTSSSHEQINQNPYYNYEYDQNNRPTFELYKEAYQTLSNNESYRDNVHENAPVSDHHSIPPPHRNNLKPVNSPLSRHHSSTEDDLSELEDFEQDPTTKMNSNNNTTH